jgi:uncharacterized membrane protein
MIYVQLFLAAAVVMVALDALWLGVVAKKLYHNKLGERLRPRPQWAAAVAFYALYLAGLVYFVLSWSVTPWEAAANGAFFGLVTYGAYELTNAATLKSWPWLLVLVDLLWGAVLTAAVSGLAIVIVDSL